jgi:serine-type D-Ala-D-Ala carboxypeptidase/endopeptidase (penicillin-binding protein 4)
MQQRLARKMAQNSRKKLIQMKTTTIAFGLLFACTISVAQVSKKTINNFLEDSTVKTGFAGISIFEPATQKYFYTYNENKNLVPCSNMKLFSLYAGLKYLGDSILTAKVFETTDTIFFEPAGDPSLLHKDYSFQPLINKLSSSSKKIILVKNNTDKFENYGSGWAWNDYSDDYMVERSRLSLYGNVFTFIKDKSGVKSIPPNIVNNNYFDNTLTPSLGVKYEIKRKKDENVFSYKSANTAFKNQEVPFITTTEHQLSLLKNQIAQKIDIKEGIATNNWLNVYSQPVDSVYKPMMFRSDNFFAEQTLLMASNAKLDFMSDEIFIDTLLKTDFKNLPTKPNWVDGSGLSRYNLFSTNNFVFLLEKLRLEFGMDRLKKILTTGGQGTLTGYYENEKGLIYAKTGSMSGNVALSGYIFTKKGKLLEFSIMINNFTGAPRGARRAIERFLRDVITQN